MSSSECLEEIVEEINKITQEIAIYFLLGWTTSGVVVIEDEKYISQSTLEGFQQVMRDNIEKSVNLYWFHRFNELERLASPTMKESNELEALMNNLTELYYSKLPRANLEPKVQEYIWVKRILPSIHQIQTLLGYTE